MALLGDAELRELRKLVQNSVCYRDLSEMGQELLARAERVFRVMGANLYLGSGDIRQVYAKPPLVTLGIDQTWHRSYSDYYMYLDPLNFWFQVPDRIAVAIKEIFPGNNCNSWLEYHSDFLRPQKIYDVLDIYIRSGARLLALIGLHRSKEQGCFTENDILKACLLAPYIATTMETIPLLTRRDCGEEAQVQDYLGIAGGILLDCDLKVTYYDSKAKEMCLALKPAPAEQGTAFVIPPHILEDCLVLKRLLDCGDDELGAGHSRILLSNDLRRILARSSLVPRPLRRVSGACFLVSLEELGQAGQSIDDILRDRYRLTRREREVSWCISQGLTNAEIADGLYISRFTVQNHIKSIFEKTGVKNRTELSRLVNNPTWTGQRSSLLS